MLDRIGPAIVVLAFSGPASACGAADDPCTIASGEYHIALPQGWQGGPAILHLHGFGGSGAKVLKNTGLVQGFTARGYAVIAPTAIPYREGKPNDWSVRDGDTYPRDDFTFLRDVLADAVSRVSVDPDEILLTGFSRGGSMVWDMACVAPDQVRAYAPIAGGFWFPRIADCAGPVHMLHTHGFADPVVPLEGRSIEIFDGRVFVQRDIWEGLQLWRRVNVCPDTPNAHDIGDRFWRKRWACENGSLEIALHAGGHGLPGTWADLALDWFESLPR